MCRQLKINKLIDFICYTHTLTRVHESRDVLSECAKEENEKGSSSSLKLTSERETIHDGEWLGISLMKFCCSLLFSFSACDQIQIAHLWFWLPLLVDFYVF